MKGEKEMKEAMIKAGAKVKLRERHCTFCNETKNCLDWCPERLPWVLPVCEPCFVKLHKTFGNIGAIVWE